MTNAKGRVFKNQSINVSSINIFFPTGAEAGLGHACNCAQLYFKPP